MYYYCCRCGSACLGTAGNCLVCGFSNSVQGYVYSPIRKYPNVCPVCKGTGLVSTPPGVAGDKNDFSSNETGPWKCRICDGEGVLWHE